MTPSDVSTHQLAERSRADAMEKVLIGAECGMLRPERPDLAPLVNWGGSVALPVHRWFRYREGFSPALMESLELGKTLLDPFCGSGSIMVGAAQRARSSIGIDVNPLAAFVARVKLAPLSAEELALATSFLHNLTGRRLSRNVWPIPALRIAEKVFEPEVRETILALRWLIEELHDSQPRVRDFLHLAWLSILQDVGSYFKEGNGIKYRNKKRQKSGYVSRPDGEWQSRRFGGDQRKFVLRIFRDRLSEMLSDVSAWGAGAWNQQTVIEGNSIEEAARLPEASIDSVIFSPPYANRFDYFESQKVELWYGGFVESYDEMTNLRKRSVRSHLGAALNGDRAPIPQIDELIDLLDPDSYAVRMRVPALLRGYFSDMAAILSICRTVLKPGGSCHIVVGNSAYAGVIIPTDALIALLGLNSGFERADVVPVRHLTVAPQQRTELLGRERFMRESIVTLS